MSDHTTDPLNVMQAHERALLAAYSDYEKASGDEEFAAADARLSEAVRTLALTPVAQPSDFLILIRHARVIAHQEADGGDWTDGRLRLLLAAVEAAALPMTERLRRLERAAT